MSAWRRASIPCARALDSAHSTMARARRGGAEASSRSAAAYEAIAASQRLPCQDVGLVRMPAFGAANDINFLVKALHWCLLWGLGGGRRRALQMVLVPPDPEVLATLGMRADVHRPWHWLREHPLSEVFRVSQCQRQLLRDNSSWLQAVATRGLTPALRAAVSFRATIVAPPTTSTGRCNRVSLPRGFEASYAPSMDCSWWWSVLTTYLLRIDGNLEELLKQQLALASRTCRRCTEEEWPAPPRGVRRPFDFTQPPASRFDVGVQVRMGDACGPQAPPRTAKNGQRHRKCFSSLHKALSALHNRTGAPYSPSTSHHASSSPRVLDVFLATDSDSFIEQARRHRDASVRIHYLTFNRSKYDGAGRIEHRSARSKNELAVLSEALLELTMLARSNVIAGQMFGNMPRLAMQLALHSAEPNVTRRYISLDGYEWCVDSRCVRKLGTPNAELPPWLVQDMCGGRSRSCSTQPAAKYWDKPPAAPAKRTATSGDIPSGLKQHNVE